MPHCELKWEMSVVVIGDRSSAVASGAETSLDLIMVQLSNDLCRIVA